MKKHFDLNAMRAAWNDEENWLTAADIIANVGPWLMIVVVLAMIISAL